MDTITIEPNLLLRSIELSDAKEIFHLIDSQPSYLSQWLPWIRHSQTVEDTKKFIEDCHAKTRANNGYHFVIVCNNSIVGILGHHQIRWPHKSTNLGYWLSENHNGKGIMTKACKALIDFSFKELGLNRIEIAAATENQKSRGVIERMGLKFEGILRQNEYLNGTYVDHAVYSILRSEWMA